LTGNILVRFDPAVTDQASILDAIRELEPEGLPGEPPLPPVYRERRGPLARARIAVPGMDRNPELALRVVDHLTQLPGVVRASASLLTGRVLVEYEEHRTTLEDLLSEVTGLELPELPDEPPLTYPLDPGPLIESAIRTGAAALGLGVLVSQQLIGRQELPGARSAARISVVLGIIQGFPAVRIGVHRLLGPTLAEPLISLPSIVTLTLSGNPFGLAIAAAEAVRVLTARQARRSAWQRYEDWIEDAPEALPGATIRLETGERTPLDASVVEGTGTAIGLDGLPLPVAPGVEIPAGSRLYGGLFTLRLQGYSPFAPQPRPTPAAPSLYDGYLRTASLASLAYAALTAVVTRSAGRTIEALLLVNARPAMVAADAADLGAQDRMTRAGVIVVNTRRVPSGCGSFRLPDVLLLHTPRVLTDGFELTGIVPLDEEQDVAELTDLAAAVAAAAGWPWGGGRALGTAPTGTSTGVLPEEGHFDGRVATATIEGVSYTLGPAGPGDTLPASLRLQHRGEALLVLRGSHRQQPLAVLVLRPHLAPGVAELVASCRRYGVELAALSAGDPVGAQKVAERAELPLLDEGSALDVIGGRQQEGAVVAFLSDSADAAPAFAACDLSIGLFSGRSSRFPARVDLLAPDLGAVASIVDATARREAGVRDGVALSAIGNILGAVGGLRRQTDLRGALLPVYAATLAALTDDWLRLRGGERSRSILTTIAEPRPWRWGRESVDEVLRAFETTDDGLTSTQALERRRSERIVSTRSTLWADLLAELTSPLTGLYISGAALSFLAAAPADVAIIVATLAVNVGVAVWQERRTGQAAESVERLSGPTARVMRDGRPTVIPANEVVPGDVLLLAPGDRVAADARVLAAHRLEVDEAALTGESLPVPKMAEGGIEANRVVLEGSDVVAGVGQAVVVAVGRQTLVGATAAALATGESGQSPLGARLTKMLGQMMPVAAGGSILAVAPGLLRRQPISAQLAIGVSLFLAAVPEGVPLLARFAEAVVARRLASRGAMVHRVAAVEALGRVNVVAVDKTGTLTKGRLSLRLVVGVDAEASLPGPLPPDLRQILLVAGLASPPPTSPAASTDAVDRVLLQAAQQAGLGRYLEAPRQAESAYESSRAFSATVARGRLFVKGAPELVIQRCKWVRRHGKIIRLTEAGPGTLWVSLLDQARSLAERGLRVLMVAEGSPETPVDDPQGLVALGFLGIADPLRPDVPDAMRRAHEAGNRVIMLTGDHPATARAIAREAGILYGDRELMTGIEMAQLDDGALEDRLERTTVIARVTPLDKLRIIERLQHRGHVVAMTGDGINDAPSLRLADVGVAMGSGTEVARQAADLVLADDDFATLVEALVEGRTYWRNVRRSLDLLIGGNLGEVGYIVGASLPGLPVLTTRQILMVNMISDILPAIALVLQGPAHRNLADLAREGTAALGKPLQDAILRRGAATATPSLAAYLLAYGTGGVMQGRTVGFASIVATQLAQTLDAARSREGPNRMLIGSLAGSAGLLAATLFFPPARTLLDLTLPSPLSLVFIAGSTLASVGMARALSASQLSSSLPALRRPLLSPTHPLTDC
jgi:calcium-translocating P-type ATPase